MVAVIATDTVVLDEGECRPHLAIPRRKGGKARDIGFVMPGYYTNPIGGYKVVFEQANRLAEAGDNVTLYFPLNANGIRGLITAVPRCWRLNRNGGPRFDWFGLHPSVRTKTVPALQPFWLPHSDVVIAVGWQTARCVAALRNRGTAKLYYVMDYEYYMSGSDALKVQLGATYRLGLKHMALAPVVADVVESYSKVRPPVLEIGLDWERLGMRIPIDAPEREWIGFPSRPEEFKRTEDAIRVCTILRESFPDLKCWSFGGKRPEAMPEWIEYHERPTDEELGELYNRTAVFLTTSDYEGWGLPGSEAMACGAALVSTDHGGVRAYAEHGVTALLTPPRAVEQLAEYARGLLAKPAERQALAQRGYASIRKFAWETAAKKLEQFIEEAVAATSGPASASTRETGGVL